MRSHHQREALRAAREAGARAALAAAVRVAERWEAAYRLDGPEAALVRQALRGVVLDLKALRPEVLGLEAEREGGGT